MAKQAAFAFIKSKMSQPKYEPDDEDQEVFAKAKKELAEIRCEFYRSEIKTRLGDFRMPTLPMRPSALPDNDYALLDSLDKARGRGWNDIQSSRLSRTFGLWRGAVIKAEMQGKANLELLLSNAQYLDDMGYDDDLNELAAFILHQYGLSVPPIPKGELEIRRIAEESVRHRSVLSDMLLTEDRSNARSRKSRDNDPQSMIFDFRE
jgi:hypothetical protein